MNSRTTPLHTKGGSERRAISVVVQARNGEASVDWLHRELLDAPSDLASKSGSIVVHSASTDQAGEREKSFGAGDPHWKCVRFSRDLCVEVSLAAGHRTAQGDAMVVLY